MYNRGQCRRPWSDIASRAHPDRAAGRFHRRGAPIRLDVERASYLAPRARQSGDSEDDQVMMVDTFFQFVAWALYLLIFVRVAYQATRHPTRANLDITLFFGAVAIIIAFATITSVTRLSQPQWLASASAILIMALPYLLLRLVSDFAAVSSLVSRLGAAGLLVSIGLLALWPGPPSVPLVLFLVIYFVGLITLSSIAFVRHAGRTGGVTRRRLQAVGFGSAFLGLDIAVAGLAAAIPNHGAFWFTLGNVLGACSGVSYYLGFATPIWLRRAWQEPELRAFLGQAAQLPRLPDTRRIVQELERGAREILGAPGATILLWDSSSKVLRSVYRPRPGIDVNSPPLSTTMEGEGYAIRGMWWEQEPNRFIVGKAFTERRAIFVEDAARADPANGALYRVFEASAILAAPIIAGEKPLGLMVVYAPRAPIFADSDLQLVQLLAEQAAVILESRSLIDEVARIQGREEATRLKEDFLSSAAHDLRTPLTGILSQAQLLRRRAELHPEAPASPGSLDRIISEARRLNNLVAELLDATRTERGRLVEARESVDLVEVAREVCGRSWPRGLSCVLRSQDTVVGHFDPVRVRQLLGNLVENAVNFSPAGARVIVQVWREGGTARIAIRDQGIGIPPEDLPLVFERFHRGTNVDDRRFVGLGLGLFISRGIVEEHGGRIWAESVLSQGSSFHVALPLEGPRGEELTSPPASKAAPNG